MKAGKSLNLGLAGAVCAMALFACAPAQKDTSSVGQDTQVMNDIVGGTSVSSGSAISKSTVAVYDVEEGALCTGSLIAKNIVVSAAHCVGANTKAMIIVFDVDLDKALGSAQTIQQMLKNPKIRQVSKAVVSAAWAAHQNDDTNTGDVSVIQFSGSLPAGFAPIERLKDATALKNGSLVTLAGYGITNGITEEGAGLLRQVQVQVSNAKFSNTEVEMDQTHGKGACHGDSGGPALINVKGKSLLFGVTSRGERDPDNSCTHFSVYTNLVAYNTMIDKAIAAMGAPAK